MIPTRSYLKLPPFGVMLYGIPPLAFLLVLLMSIRPSSWNSVEISIAVGNASSLFIISTLLGIVVDSYFRSTPEASFPKILILGGFAWSFLFAASILIVGYISFEIYDTSHHTRFMPQDLYSSWSSFIGHLLQGAFLGGILFLPVNSLLALLVRRRYRRPNPLLNSDPA
jgi:hypothetical protein